MVCLSRILFDVSERRLPRKYLRTKFLDTLRIYVKGGSGGTGIPKYRGPGGQGGCVYCVGKENSKLETVARQFRGKTIAAGHGGDSTKNKIAGAPGQDIKLEVPFGVTIYSEDGKEIGQVNSENDSCILARGGPGGNAENNYLGRAGQAHHIRLDLKLIADIGLVGFPNAGKSSLLKAISRAKPRIASYPFTTMKPNIGMIYYQDHRQISMADLPGLIEGAHVNIGLGHKFLKHVERTKLLLVIADVNGFILSHKHPYRTCFETVMLLNKELELYNKDLLDKPAILALNKLDIDGAFEKYQEVLNSLQNAKDHLESIPEELRPERLMQFEDIVGISAKNDKNSIENLKLILRERLDEYAEKNNPDIVDPADLLRKNRSIVHERGPQIT